MLPVLQAAAAMGIALLPIDAEAFERPWRVGGGIGVETLPGSDIGPALGVHTAYGVSDYFDLHLEILGSQHGGVDATRIGSASLGISYKIDVFQWIPYVGVSAGAYYYDGTPGPHGEHGFEPGASVGGGLDYLFSRSFSMGAALRQHSSFRGGLSFSPCWAGVCAALTILLRAEYRWGF
jgi:hypothetical protein